MSARSVIAVYSASMAGLTAVVLAVPAWSLAAWTVLGVCTAFATIAGVAWHRPARSWPWALLAGSIVVSTLADVFYTQGSYLSAANLLYLGTFVASAVALLRFARSGSRGLEQAGLLDALTVTLVLVLLVWVTAISPVGLSAFSLADPGPVAYAIGDALLLATAVRLLTGRRRTPAVVLLVVGATAALIADGVAASAGTQGLAGGVENVCWLLFYVCWGAAALHPSMVRLTAPEVMGERELTLRRLWVMALTAVTPPLILLIESIAGHVRDGVILALATVGLFLLSLTRVAAMANSHRRSLVFRERHDTLTGLANRAVLVDRVSAAVTNRRDDQIAVMLIDLDEFRLVNDMLGHSVGDEVLVAVGRRLVRQLSRHDLVARFGGDQFAILVGPTPAGRNLTALVSHVAAATAEPVMVGGRPISVSTSIGMAIVDSEAVEPPNGQDLLRQAGLALQAAKETGPGQWCRYESERHGLMVERMRLREALGRAVTEGSFALQYQPIVSLETSATVGFEALVRWEHPTRGLVAPSEFIAIAEETGLIEPIGDLVLRTAVAAAVGWTKASATEAYVSVNVSARQFRNPGLAERVERLLASAGLRPSLLMLEVTESVLMREDDHVWAELATLRNVGVRLAIDDFGTGFSSLSYLEQTPIDVIKIDKSFVGTLVNSDRQRTVVEGVVRMAEKLGLQIVAEGIETEAERDLLAEMRCPYGQGYLYAVPLTNAEATNWLAYPPEPKPAPKATPAAAPPQGVSPQGAAPQGAATPGAATLVATAGPPLAPVPTISLVLPVEVPPPVVPRPREANDDATVPSVAMGVTDAG